MPANDPELEEPSNEIKVAPISKQQILNACYVFTDFLEASEILSFEDIILGKDAQLKKAYRQLSLKFHPDKNPGYKKAEAQFKELNVAYELLAKAVKLFQDSEKVDELEGTPLKTRQTFLSDSSFQEYEQWSIKAKEFWQKMNDFRATISTCGNATLIAQFQDHEVVANIKKLYERGYFDFDMLNKIVDEFFLREEVNPAVAESLAEAFAVLADPYYISYDCLFAPPNKKPLCTALVSIQKFLQAATPTYRTVQFITEMKECAAKTHLRKEIQEKDILARSNLTVLQKFHLFSCLTKEQRLILNAIPLNDLKWEVIEHLLKKHEEECAPFVGSLPTPGDNDAGPWLHRRIEGFANRLLTDQYLTIVKLQVLDRIETQKQFEQQKKALLETTPKTSKEDIALVTGKIAQLQAAQTEIKQTILERVYNATSCDDGLPDAREVTTCDFRYKYKYGHHLQNQLEQIVKKHAADQTVCKSMNPAKDFFRGLLGVVLAIPTVLLLVSSSYRHFLGRTFFRTQTQSVLRESARNCRSPVKEIESIENRESHTEEEQAKQTKAIETVVCQLRGG